MAQIPEKFQPGGPIPQNMGSVVDLYAEVRELRLAMEKEVDPFKKRESELREHMIQNIAKSREDGGDTGAAGRTHRVQIRDKEVVRVNDWKPVHEWIAEHGRFDLLQKRLSDKPVKELLESGTAIDGLETMLIPDVSITKI